MGHNVINEQMTRNVYGCEGMDHDQVMGVWKAWTTELVKIQRADGCEVYGDMADCFWEYFAEGATPQEAWNEEKSYASGDIDNS